jgi:hypothetical protein
MVYISTNVIVANFMKNIKDIFVFYIYARPNFAKTKRGASGGFLPRPLLLRLRHPNSEKRNQPKFCGILSPENCFRKTSSALFQISSSGLLSKKVRILSRTYRQKTKSGSDAKIWSARSAVCSEFHPKNPESKRVRHAERGSSLANATI